MCLFLWCRLGYMVECFYFVMFYGDIMDKVG